MSAHEIRWWGHAAVELRTAAGAVLFIDPWLTNPVSPAAPGTISRLDGILITHDHFDHVGDTVTLSQAHPCQIACQPEIATRLRSEGVASERFTGGGIGMNTGGTVDIAGCLVTMTQAWHSAASGTAAGFIVRLPDGYTVYHAGDTSVFGDMELLARLYPIDLAVLPIGGHFTMDAIQAAMAVRLLQPSSVLPIHYGTFGLLAPDSQEFSALVHEHTPAVSVLDLRPGETAHVHA